MSRIRDLLAGDTVKRLRKMHGHGIFGIAGDNPISSCPRIPTGVFMLDYALGGGFPVGLISILYGHKSAAKTTLLLKGLANAQKQCAHCWQLKPCDCGEYRMPVSCFLDVEGCLDMPWAQQLGVDLNHMFVSKPEFAEQTLDIAEALVREGVDIMVLDSLAFLTPAKEIEESTAKETMGLQARIIGKGIRKFIAAMNHVSNGGSKVTYLFTNQIRMKIGVMFGSPETTPGGLAHGFASAVEVRLAPGKYEMDEHLGKPLTAAFRYRVEKNKVSSAKMSGDFKLAMMDTETKQLGDALNEADMLKMAEKLGFLSGGGTKWSLFGETFKRKSEIPKRLEGDPVFYELVRASLMATLLAV